MELTRRLRKQIEWHFFNISADKALYDELRNEIIDSHLNLVGVCYVVKSN